MLKKLRYFENKIWKNIFFFMGQALYNPILLYKSEHQKTISSKSEPI